MSVPEDGPTTLYRWFDADGKLLYVGVTRDPEARFYTHKNESRWWAEAVTCRLERHSTRTDALAAELQAIRTEAPTYNLSGRLGLPRKNANNCDPKWFRPDGSPNNLVGASEIASRAGVVKATVWSWQKRHSDFPAPWRQLEMGPVWDWAEVKTWLQQRKPLTAAFKQLEQEARG